MDLYIYLLPGLSYRVLKIHFLGVFRGVFRYLKIRYVTNMMVTRVYLYIWW